VSGAWRLLADDGAGAAEGLALDEALMAGTHGRTRLPTDAAALQLSQSLRPRRPVPEPGREVDLAACRRTGTEVSGGPPAAARSSWDPVSWVSPTWTGHRPASVPGRSSSSFPPRSRPGWLSWVLLRLPRQERPGGRRPKDRRPRALCRPRRRDALPRERPRRSRRRVHAAGAADTRGEAGRPGGGRGDRAADDGLAETGLRYDAAMLRPAIASGSLRVRVTLEPGAPDQTELGLADVLAPAGTGRSPG